MALSSLFQWVDFILNCKGISLCDIYKASNLGENPHFQKKGKKKGGFKKKTFTGLLNYKKQQQQLKLRA